MLRLAVADREHRIKTLLARELPHGCRQVIADILDTRPERISRELSHEDDPKAKLSLSVLAVALEILRLEGKGSVADEIIGIRDAGQPLAIVVDVARLAITREPDGSVHVEIGR